VFAAEQPCFAQGVTYSISGTMGPNLNSGPDCLTWDNQPVSVQFNLGSGQVPTRSTTNSVTYTAAAAITAGSYSATGLLVEVTLTLTRQYNTMVVMGSLPGIGTLVVDAAFAPGSINPLVLKAPEPLRPKYDPQALQPPGSHVGYEAPECQLTRLGVSGTFSTTVIP
jgi:hypothetical protein